MATESDILKRECAVMTRDSAEEVREDIYRGLQGLRDIKQPDVIGSPTGPTRDISPQRSILKARRGGINPTKPRIMFGGLLGSIFAQPIEGGSAFVSVLPGEQAKAIVQQQGGGPWTDEEGRRFKSTKPRPFFGVSDEALKKVDRVVEDTGKRIEQQFAGADSFGTIKVVI